MAGSATLGSNVTDRLAPRVDTVRSRVHSRVGTRQYRLFRIVRTWLSGAVGEGGDTAFTEAATEITPPPRVRGFQEVDGRLMPAGLDEAGFVRVDKISLTYTEAELYPTDNSEPDDAGGLEPGQEVLYRIDDGHGQGIRSRFFTCPNPPISKRDCGCGWELRLERSWEPA